MASYRGFTRCLRPIFLRRTSSPTWRVEYKFKNSAIFQTSFRFQATGMFINRHYNHE